MPAIVALYHLELPQALGPLMCPVLVYWKLIITSVECEIMLHNNIKDVMKPHGHACASF